MPFLGVEPVQEFASVAKQTITGDGSTAYTLTHSVGSANDLAVFVNNVRQEPTTAYSASGATITFTSALASTDSCYIVYIARTFQTAVPEDNSINADQISYPLTNFSSTGIDDNSTSTALTIASNGNVTFGGEVDAGESRFLKPSTFWSGSAAFFGHNYGSLATQGNYDLHLTANGYRNSSGTWTSLAVNSKTGASQIALDPDGEIGFNTDATKANGDSNTVTRRMTIDADGNVGIGTDAPSSVLHLRTSNDPVITLEDTGFGASATLKGSNGNIRVGSTTATHFDIGGSERMRIDSNGRLLLNTSTPDSNARAVFEASATYSAGLSIRSTSNVSSWARMDFVNQNTTGHGLIYLDSVGNFVFRNDATSAKVVTFIAGNSADGVFKFESKVGTERMRVVSDGGVRIGHTTNIFNGSTQERFTVKNTVRGCAATFEATDVSGGFPILYLKSSDTTASQNCVLFYRGGTNIGGITTSASSTAYNTSSDYRLKENVVSLNNATDRLKQIRVHRFNFITDPNITVDGFLAHEVSGIVPEAVSGEHNGVDASGDPVYQGIDQSKLVPLLTKAIQELEARVTALEAS